MRLAFLLAVTACLLASEARATGTAPSGRPVPQRPNIIVLLADDLGYGDLGSYGHPVHRTPSIDRLAAEGQRWTDFYAAAPVCTPSRGSLLTGRLPMRLGLEASPGAPNVFFTFSTGGLPLEEVTIAELLGSAGYATALIGKWHLGFAAQFSPKAQGFDTFFGTLGSNDMEPVDPRTPNLFTKKPDPSDWNVALYRDAQVVEQPLQQETLTTRYTEEAVTFIRRNRSRPFFLMLSYNAPHVPLFPSKQFRGHSLGGLYADVVEELDWSVGRVMAVVRDLRLDDRTLVVFTSDNGPMDLFGRYGGSAGALRGGKGTTWEGGMRVPGIFWGPAFVKAGVEHGIGSQLDLLPTIAELTRQALPAGRVLDGQSLLATLESGAPSPRTTLPYYRNGGVYALRMGAIKAHFVTEGVYGAGEPLTRHEPPLFFDLSQDISERSPLEDTSPDVQAKLQAARRLLEQTVRPAPSQLTKGLPPVSGEK